MLLFASLVLLSAAFASALTTTPEKDRTTTGTASVPPSTGLSTERVQAELPATEPVIARIGDVVQIDVTATEADRVEILDLGIGQPVNRDTPTSIVLVADRAGTFPVTLRLAGERIGTLEVRAP